MSGVCGQTVGDLLDFVWIVLDWRKAKLVGFVSFRDLLCLDAFNVPLGIVFALLLIVWCEFVDFGEFWNFGVLEVFTFDVFALRLWCLVWAW